MNASGEDPRPPRRSASGVVLFGALGADNVSPVVAHDVPLPPPPPTKPEARLASLDIVRGFKRCGRFFCEGVGIKISHSNPNPYPQSSLQIHVHVLYRTWGWLWLAVSFA